MSSLSPSLVEFRLNEPQIKFSRQIKLEILVDLDISYRGTIQCISTLSCCPTSS
jgi:hypothetical protein